MAVSTNLPITGSPATISDLAGSGFETSLSGIPYTTQDTGDGFGVMSGTSLTTSRTVINTIDLISEGEIEGLVSGEYVLSGTIGHTGYSTGDYVSFGDFPENQLRSIYLNETPVTSEGLNDKNYYNFQNFKYAISDGDAKGIDKDDSFLLTSDALKTQKSSTINERIYGPENDGTVYPKSYRILNTNLSSFLMNVKIPSLSYVKAGSQFTEDEQNKQVGSTVVFNTQYRALYKNGSSGGWETDSSSSNSSVSGLISNAYVFTIKTTPDQSSGSIVKENLIGWEFQITRTTLDSINAFVQNESYLDSTTEIFQTSLSYPNSAVIGSQFDAEFFSQVPNRAFDVKLLKVKIPSNYDPVHKSYNGNWTGSFKNKKYWTDNPAWIFYDLVTNKRYGLGRYIESVKIDKWSLYKIAQYCDVLVDDGQDGVEPRFSANVYINSREEAFKVLQDFASIFRGIIYYGLGNINAIQDSEREPVIQFTNANVKEGDFSYSSTAKKTRYSVAVIRYNDKENFYKAALEYVEDVDAIRKYGIRETEVTAFGCTSKAQAVRLGRWILHTNNFEQETVSFSAGMESLLVRPGDLIRIADKNRGLNLLGGRTLDISQTGVCLDRTVDIQPSTSYSLTLTNPTYFYDPEQTSSDSSFESPDIADLRKPQVNKIDFVTNGAGASTGFTFGTGVLATGINGPISGLVIGFPNGSIPSAYNAETGLAWSLDDNVYEPEYYNVIDVREEEDLDYQITASKHYSGKFAAIESGITFTPRDPGIGGTAAPPPNPTGISGTLASLTTNSKKITYTIGCPATLGTTSHYEVYIKTGQAWGQTSDWVDSNANKPIPKPDFRINTVPAIQGQTVLTKDYVPPVNNTGYYLLAYALNAGGVYSNSYVTGAAVNVTNHFPIKDVSIHSLRLTSDSASNSAATKNAGLGGVIYPSAKDQTFTWDVSFENGTPPVKLDYRVTARSPIGNSALTGTVLGGGSATYVTKSRTFDFPFLKNAAISSGPYRHYDLAVEAHDTVNGGYSTDGSANPSAGYDIVEVDNIRPSGYWLTPRHYQERGARPGTCQAYEDLCTEQLITSDGKIRVLLRQFGTQFNDIVGGHIYLSAKPFSTGDFTYSTGALGAHDLRGGLTGVPDNVRRENTLGLTTISEKEEHSIISIPFVDTAIYKECTNGVGCGSNGALMNSNLIVATANFDSSSPLRIGFDRALYMAISFFDSYDYAMSGINATNWNDGQWVGFARPYIHTGNAGALVGIQTQQNQGFYTGETAASANASGIYTPVLTDEDYIADPSDIIPAPYFENTGAGLVRSRFTGFSGVAIHPSKFTSAAGLSPYHAWVRLNVNGQWEGNGIERVRMLSAKDIDVYYNFNGFFEYSCQFFETTDGGYLAPNDAGSRSVCRFTQGKIGGFPPKGDYFQDSSIDANDTLTGLRVGVPLFWQAGYLAGTKYSSADINDENITSYNETGAAAQVQPVSTEGMVTATRPLHGFRRFRVYFDSNNLPAESAAGALASYSIVGMNAWNGKYAAWPGGTSPSNNLLFEREGTDIFSAGTVQTWLSNGDVFDNIPGVWNHHPAGFGQGYGGLIKTQKYFDVHMGRMVDDSYLEEAIFSAVATTDYSIKSQTVDTDKAAWGSYDNAMVLSNGYFVHDYDQGYSGLGYSTTEATALSGWYRASESFYDPYP